MVGAAAEKLDLRDKAPVNCEHILKHSSKVS